MFQDVRHDRSLVLILSLIDEGLLRHVGLLETRENIMKGIKISYYQIFGENWGKECNTSEQIS